jgi:hypothetical protein
MWMLNYPFPYSAPDVGAQFGEMSRLLAEALRARRPKELRARVSAYLDARRKFQTMLAPDDYKYFSFQVWQEGVARYAEHRVAEAAARGYRPSREFRSLKDYRPFKAVAEGMTRDLLRELTTPRLAERQRAAFYPLGAGEALLLDRLNPRWKGRYFADRFYVEKYFSDPGRAARSRAGTPTGRQSPPR